MIYRICSSLPTFKELEFHPGLNIVLAEKTPGASERQTRNRAGKSSITEIIHFLTAGNVEKGSIFKEECLKEETFGMEFDLGGESAVVERVPEKRTMLRVAGGKTAHWPVQPTTEKKSGDLLISNKLWKTVLGDLMFGLAETEGSFGPTFRSMFSYFVRRHSNGGFASPFRNSTDQTSGNAQVNISYLLDLDWSIPQQWQLVREQEKSLKALKKAAKEGALGDIISTTSDLRTQLTVAEARASRLRQGITDFRVLPEYRQIEQEASDLTRDISRLSDDNVLDRQLIDDLDESLKQEIAPPVTRLEEIYSEAGVTLPGVALQQFDDVRAFHDSVVSNRRSYLQGEISEARRRLEKRQWMMEQHEVRRSEVMSILQTHGALDHFSKLQEELARVEADVENLKQRYSTAEKLETGKTDLELERQQLLRRLREDYNEQASTLDQAILAFEEFSNALYEDVGRGSLVIGKDLNGPEFNVRIQGKRSGGVSNMQIYCFDMMLMKLCAERGMGPGFLFHDSHLFDGVDERQVAKALQIGSETADELAFQYIVTMNEDSIPTELPEGFVFDDHVIPTHLTDATEDGGLFGIRFG